MNGPHKCTTAVALDELLRELTDEMRPIPYRLSEILVVSTGDKGWLVFWKKDVPVR